MSASQQSARTSVRIPSLYEIFCSKLANGFRQLAKWRKEGLLPKAARARRRQSLRLETLEPRVLLSADISYAAASGAALDAALRIADVDGTQMLQLVDNVSSAVLGQEALDEDINVTVNGGDLNDSLIIDFNSAAAGHQINVSYDGGAGDDTLRGPTDNTVWTITGANEGSAGTVSFSGVENLKGAADNEDTFVFEQNGSLSGVVDGGDGGFDSLVVNGSYDTIVFTPTGPDAGTVDLDGNLITYAGLEPVLVNAGTPADVIFNGTGGVDNWVVEDSLTAGQIQVSGVGIETTSFANPTTLTINLAGGNDLFTFESFGDSGFSGSVIVNGEGGDDTFTFSGITSTATYAINGGAHVTGDTIVATATVSQSLNLSGAALVVGSESITISGIEVANLSGGTGDNTITVSNWSGTANINGQGGNDSYNL